VYPIYYSQLYAWVGSQDFLPLAENSPSTGNNVLTTVVVGFLTSGAVAAVLAFYISKKKLPVEIESLRIATAAAAVNTANEMIDGLRIELARVQTQSNERAGRLSSLESILLRVLYYLEKVTPRDPDIETLVQEMRKVYYG
jgi:hypothetical protein